MPCPEPDEPDVVGRGACIRFAAPSRHADSAVGAGQHPPVGLLGALAYMDAPKSGAPGMGPGAADALRVTGETGGGAKPQGDWACCCVLGESMLLSGSVGAASKGVYGLLAEWMLALRAWA